MTTRPLGQEEKLSLETRGELALFFVGVGSAFSKRLNQTNLLILKGKDHVLVDCGSRTPFALHGMGQPVTNIKNFVVTHTHADHVGGLEEVMLLGRYVTKQRPKLIIPPALEPLLWDCCLKGGAGFNERAEGGSLSLADYWEILRPEWLEDYQRETWDAQIGGINLKLFRTMHIPEQAKSWEDSVFSLGVLIDERVFFTADTRFDPGLLDEFGGRFELETIFHDCQFFPGGIHASLEELASCPKELRNRMYLTHYQDSWEESLPRVEKLGFAGFALERCYYSFG